MMTALIFPSAERVVKFLKKTMSGGMFQGSVPEFENTRKEKSTHENEEQKKKNKSKINKIKTFGANSKVVVSRNDKRKSLVHGFKGGERERKTKQNKREGALSSEKPPQVRVSFTRGKFEKNQPTKTKKNKQCSFFFFSLFFFSFPFLFTR
jgi:hypothetical protein